MIFFEKQEIVMRHGDLTCQMFTQPTRIKDTLTKKNVPTVTILVCLTDTLQGLLDLIRYHVLFLNVLEHQYYLSTYLRQPT